jgi:hypothetical protein
MRRMKIEQRLKDAVERFPKKVAALKAKGKWSAAQEERAVKEGRKTK